MSNPVAAVDDQSLCELSVPVVEIPEEKMYLHEGLFTLGPTEQGEELFVARSIPPTLVIFWHRPSGRRFGVALDELARSVFDAIREDATA